MLCQQADHPKPKRAALVEPSSNCHTLSVRLAQQPPHACPRMEVTASYASASANGARGAAPSLEASGSSSRSTVLLPNP